MVEPAWLEARSPASGEIIGRYPVAGADEIDRALARARSAFAGWGRRSLSERLAAIRRLRHLMIEELEAIVAALVAATGKPRAEALAGDVLTCLQTMSYFERHAAAALAAQPRRRGLIFGPSRFHVEYAPIGVVAVFSPWNYPLQLALIPTLTALVAGNAVLLKPSEVTPSIGALAFELCTRAGLPEGVVQVLQGGADVGERLIAAGPDKIFFTGSTATGRKVMRAAAERLIPLELELGGKDPMVVFADAHLERAARGAVWGAFCNAGQACVSVERLYVEDAVHDRLVEVLVSQTQKLRVTRDGSGDLGPIISAAQERKIEEHLDDALQKGARLATPRRREGNLFWPVILTRVDPGMRVMQEETFGPILPVMPFGGEEQAVALANDSVYGLNASVWTRDLERGRRVASRIVAGSCAVNDVLKNISNPDLPFGGERQSGFGRYHGPEGLRALSRTKAVMVARGRLGREVSWFPYSDTAYRGLKRVVRLLYGARRPLSQRA